MDISSVKVQATVTGKAAELYKLVGKKSKSAAITAALLILARNKRLKEIFFTDTAAVDKILNNGDNEEEQKEATMVDGWE